MDDRATILCVDDEPMMLDIIEGHLFHENYNLIRYSSGVNLLKDSVSLKRCDMILLDVMMPEIDGIEVTRRIRELQKRFLPVILITALGTTEHKVMGLDAGATDFITKPVSEAELRARVRAHLRAKRMNDELVRMTALKETLVSTVVHDIRTPLTTIQMALSLILDSGDPSMIDKSIWERASWQTKSAIELCEQLLDIKLHEQASLKLNPRTARLGQTVEDAILALADELAEKRISVVRKLEDSVIHTDHFHLRRVLMNLLQNAIRHSSEGDSVEVQSIIDHDRVRIYVADNGTGISAAEQEDIFEMYVARSVDGGNQSRGIGLAFCRIAIENMGGSIELISRPGEGCRFEVSIPLRHSAVSATAATDNGTGIRV